MAEIIVRRWRAEDGALSLASIRRLHEPNNRHYFSSATYPAGVTITPSRRAGTLYIASGSCTYGRVSLTAGDVADVPEGTYKVEVGLHGVVFLNAYPVPFEITQKP